MLDAQASPILEQCKVSHGCKRFTPAPGRHVQLVMSLHCSWVGVELGVVGDGEVGKEESQFLFLANLCKLKAFSAVYRAGV